VPGIDGVGRLPDGRHVYFVLPDTTCGSMADRAVIDARRSVVVPDDLDPVVLAAAMNPAMSSWVGLRHRTDFCPGQSVLVLGATGNAGQLAVQVAKHLGASYVIGAGRDARVLDLLPGMGADAVVSLVGEPTDVDRRLGAAAAEVDVVVDYLWGEPAANTMVALLRARADRGRALTWVQIGSVAGPTTALPSVALRSANLRVVGSGQGSVGTAQILAELPEIAREVARGALTVRPTATLLSDIEQTWTAPVAPGERLVVVP
jgi:NADPH:quinone reductase-like Zn-dependent oxidoreductase